MRTEERILTEGPFRLNPFQCLEAAIGYYRKTPAPIVGAIHKSVNNKKIQLKRLGRIARQCNEPTRSNQ
jgi:hypothetical protein